eukprot:1156367-Pelagomonas_calceolata.AAC.3
MGHSTQHLVTSLQRGLTCVTRVNRLQSALVVACERDGLHVAESLSLIACGEALPVCCGKGVRPWQAPKTPSPSQLSGQLSSRQKIKYQLYSDHPASLRRKGFTFLF